MSPILFSYGTLQHEDVQLSTFGRRLDGVRGALPGWKPALVPIDDPRVVSSLGRTHHANVEIDPDGAGVDGTAFEVTDAELARADEFEAAFFYERIALPLASGRDGWVYVHAPAVSFRFGEAIPVLRRTPNVLRALLLDLPHAWTHATEGPGTWSPFDVVGHLIHGERTNWMPRVEHIVRHGEAVPYPVFDREAMFSASQGRTLGELLDEFEEVRGQSLARLDALKLADADLDRRGRHPEFGSVTMRQQLATWVAHDLGHLGQVVRVMARRYTDAVGPWRAYLSMLRRP